MYPLFMQGNLKIIMTLFFYVLFFFLNQDVFPYDLDFKGFEVKWLHHVFIGILFFSFLMFSWYIYIYILKIYTFFFGFFINNCDNIVHHCYFGYNNCKWNFLIVPPLFMSPALKWTNDRV